ncbi:MAG: hypothetical protein H6649_15185 [Caldilineae bacterium]|nr:hypothetical protein [Anaerolineae bacterium]MCB0204939.1 hypothetical protein [Anaerolineae bacterium]MCB0254322.1 hypothetical protein [Anaerolineae bacterium]MCB9155386.1 hypothetical protein [Caldilineae bacterium]
MKRRSKVLIGVAIGLAAVLLIGYFGTGYAIYDKLVNVTGSCNRHAANRPGNFALPDER